jgi:hypothetical protein
VEWLKVKALSSSPSTTHTKNKNFKSERKGWRCGQVVEYLPTKHRALSLNPIMGKKIVVRVYRDEQK